MIASSLVRAGEIVHVVFCTRMWTPDLTLALTTNESCHLEQQPTRCDCRVENPEEQVHWLLTRRAQVILGDLWEKRPPPTNHNAGNTRVNEQKNADTALIR